VLLGAALISAPAPGGAVVDGSTATQTALTRYLVCAVLCWLGLAVVAMLVGPAPRQRPVETAEPVDGTVPAAADQGDLAA
jgi:hypothetical protein